MKITKPNLFQLLAPFLAVILFFAFSPFALAQTIVVNSSFTSNFGNPFANGWANGPGADFDWVVNSGGTPSAGTGPSAAYSGADYVYAESSFPNNPGKVAVLYSPTFDLTALNEPRITYYVHMQGAAMGTLWMDISTDGGATWEAKQITLGDQGIFWVATFANIENEIGDGTSVKFRFRAITGSSFTSDIAIDYFRLTDLSPRLAGEDVNEQVEEQMEEVATEAICYPNPFQDELTLEIPEQNGPVNLRMYDMQGKLVLERDSYANGQSLKMDTRDVVPGVYMLRISSDDFSQAMRVVRQ